MVTVAIIANFIVLWWSTRGYDTHLVEDAILLFFVVELVAKFIYLGWDRFRRDNWNLFDAFVVILGVLPWIGVPLPPALAGLRTLRLLKIISIVPAFRTVIDALARSMSGMMAVLGTLVVFMAISSLMATLSFQSYGLENFSSFERSFYTLLQAMAFDDIGAIIAEAGAVNPIGVWLTFGIFYMSAVLVSLNLIIGVMSNAFEPEQTEDENIIALRKEVKELKAMIRKMDK